ncbi:MAG: hypothetical protein LC642_04850 [Verrucomicrobiaceae bacterium]|nr:hypothetical protein [Verrucomicrobiaceae bacterium]
MNTYSSTKPSAIEENASKFESDVAETDAVRASALAGLQRLRAAKASHAEREQKWLAANRGEEDPDVIGLKTEIAEGLRLSRELGAEAERATAAAPKVDERGWALHGFVRNQELQGQPNLTVALFDGKQRWVEMLGHACTDRRGYFKLSFSPAADSKEASDPTGQRMELFVHVSDRKREILYRDPKPMLTAAGEVRYREIILGDKGDNCQPPEEMASKESSDQAESTGKASKARKNRPTKKASKKEN